MRKLVVYTMMALGVVCNTASAGEDMDATIKTILEAAPVLDQITGMVDRVARRDASLASQLDADGVLCSAPAPLRGIMFKGEEFYGQWSCYVFDTAARKAKEPFYVATFRGSVIKGLPPLDAKFCTEQEYYPSAQGVGTRLTCNDNAAEIYPKPAKEAFRIEMVVSTGPLAPLADGKVIKTGVQARIKMPN